MGNIFIKCFESLVGLRVIPDHYQFTYLKRNFSITKHYHILVFHYFEDVESAD